MHPLILSLLLAFLALSPSPSLSDPDPLASADRTALLLFKSSIRSDPLGLLSQWGAHSDHCSWSGVACDASSRVVALNISGAGPPSVWPPCSRSGPFRPACPDPARRLSGQLTSAFGDLTALQILSLPFHRFSGEIPADIWGLQNLQVLDLEGNLLLGTLASASRFPKNLRVLNLASNFIAGEIPVSLSSSVNLQTLDLSGNAINGSIPEFIGSFPKLRELRLSFNRIGSPIPEKIGNCRSLEVLDLSGNLLVEGIPRSLGNCSELKYLLLFSNLLDEIIPSDLGRLRKLQVLDVSRNSLSGQVPAELGNCIDLSVLVLSNQYDPMPSEDPSNFVDNDEFNYFQGGISEKITALPKLRILWASRTTLEGEFPKDWGACKSLEMVNLGENLFTGEIPAGFGRCKNLKLLNLSSNNLTGWLREEVPVPCMAVFDVSGNKLSGMIPRFIYKGCLSSPLPPDGLSSMYSSFFRYRTRKGITLPSFESAANLAVYHNFGRNNFAGSLPSFPTDGFGNQTIYAFLADGNSIVGSLNDTLFGKCNYFNGLILSLSNNLIAGAVPAQISSMCSSLVVLNVAGNRISGMIPYSIGSLRSLVGLDLSMNRLQGQIPADFGKLKGLNHLSLAGNNLTGEIPSEIGLLTSLRLLDLSSNSLTGEIPGSLVTLINLTVLLLNNNKLFGKIPSGFANVRSLSMFNVSYNNLSGPLPLNDSTFRCDSVLGNPLLQSCHVSSLSIPPSYVQGRTGDSQIYAGPPPGTSLPESSSGGFSSIEIASVSSASVIIAVLFALIALYIFTRRCSPGSSANSLGRREVSIFVDIGVPLTYEIVVRATGSFNASNCIGSGGFGATYKAEISPGVLVAIKRLSVGRIQGVQQFHAEIKTLGRWRHPNLVTLIGYHIGEAEMFLIYNYLPGGNLEKFIQERSKRAVDWRMLHKIAFDVARALAYLHNQCVPRILHRDVKPSNILLDNDFNAYLSDFGLARLLGNSETHATTGVAGTFGYVAPEYAMTCRVSDKADVYSYGVVLLELISNKKALDPSFSPYGNGFNIVAWACMLLGQGRSREFFADGLWEVSPHDDLVETLHLAVKCTVDSLTIRPTMSQVVKRLKELQPPSC